MITESQDKYKTNIVDFLPLVGGLVRIKGRLISAQCLYSVNLSDFIHPFCYTLFCYVIAFLYYPILSRTASHSSTCC
jgi:hypothetical protein